MIQTIRADFYRLFHSKGFWITEFVLLANILLGVLYKVTSRFGTSISTDSQDVAQQVPEKMTGINALAHFSGHSDSIIFFTLIIVCLLLGVDLSRKLYKNSLAHGISRTEFFLSKTLVSFVVTIFQFILLLGLSFIIASSINGIGTAPAGFFGQFFITILVQLIVTIAWIGIVSFVLYLSHSIAAVFVTYFIGSALLAFPVLLYPHVELFRYLTLRFGIEMAADPAVVLQASLVAIGIAVFFLGNSLLIFKKKDL
ncbi:lantibiotic ABC transporter permease [uncultured Streptococcus sp.]|jgi:hypothetical protein|uniref:lantibiotic ABC transporter permease n=1 Tax=uncultured Streptococcus sp. TaxID=83427 RepID=UPI0028D7841F|nr:lantibiotic ABC transporter permease [uncultured Streptococcus sp.]